MHRRQLLTLLGGGAAMWPLTGRAQAPHRYRVAWVSIDRANPDSPFFIAFLNGMRDVGWIEGRDFVLDAWWAEGSAPRLRSLIPEIAASRPDVIVAAGGAAVRSLIDADVSPPIVFTYSADVVLGKVVQDWARPGVNRTGVSFFSLELMPKRVEFMREVMPGLRRVAIVGWPRHPGELLELEAAATAAERLGLQHQYYGATSVTELDAAFLAIQQWDADAILAFAGGITSAHPDRFAAFSARSRIPAVSAWAVFAERGNLMTYGPVLRDCYVRLASYVDRVLKGAKPENMPVERPTKFELVINLKTAKTLGLAIPETMLARADAIIE